MTDSELDLTVESWLESLGLQTYAAVFAENDVDGEILADLTVDDLKEMGITSIGHRRKMLAAIENLKTARQPVSVPAPDDMPAPQSGAAAQRRQTTMFFSDLVGFTALIDRLDPETVHELLSAYKEVCAEVINSQGGYVMQYLGDGILATFGYPQARGDDSARAVRAGLQLVEAVAELKTPDGEALAARVGLATGVVVTGELSGEAAFEREMLVGKAPNLAARLQAEAAPGQVFIAASTADLIGGQFICENMGTRNLKGFDEPMRMFQVLGESRTESRFEARLRVGDVPIAGRAAEVAMLKEQVGLAATGQGQVVVIEGEAGIGKSRLAAEMARTAPATGQPRLLLQTSPQNTGTPFYAIIKFIEYASEILPEESPDDQFVKVVALLQGYTGLSDKQLVLMARLLGIEAGDFRLLEGFDPREIRAQTMSTLVELMLAIAASGTLIVIEDLHWVDPSTRELLERVIPQIADLPAVVLITTRPMTDDLPFRTTGALHVSNLALDRLTAEEARSMVTSIVPAHLLGEATLDAIVVRSDGVPIFAEELAYAMRDATKAPGEAPPGSNRIQTRDVPSTLTESLMARLDRLSHGREIAQYAAVVGNEVPVDLLKAILPLKGKVVVTGIDELIAARVLVRQETSFGEVVAFRQALLRDCAYGLVLNRERLRIHRDIADAATTQFPEVGTRQLDFVPRHLEWAGEEAAAIEAWQQAGRNASAQAAVGEAVAHFGRALELCRSRPESSARDEQELGIQTELAFPMMAFRGWTDPDAMAHVDRAVELSVMASERHRMVPVLFAKWLVSTVTATTKEARVIAGQVVEAAQDGGEVERLLVARVASTQSMIEGALENAHREAMVFKELYDPARHDEELIQRGATHHSVTIDMSLSTVLALMGRQSEAEQLGTAAIQAARTNRHINTICQTLVAAGGFCAALQRDGDKLEQYSAELAQITARHDMPFWCHHIDLFLGLSKALDGQAERGLAQARKGIDGILDVRSFAKTAWLHFYADICDQLGDDGEVQRALSIAEPVITGGEHWFVAEHLRLRGRRKLRNDDNPAKGLADLTEAVRIARKQSAGLLEARAIADLEQFSSQDPGTTRISA